MKSKIVLIIIMLFNLIIFIYPIEKVESQNEKINIAVLPFLIDTNQAKYSYDYSLNLSKTITTKLYYSTKENVVSMALMDKELKNRNLDDLINIKEPNLYLMAQTNKWDYIIIPKIKINNKGKYRIEGLLYNVSRRIYQNNSIIKGDNIEKSIYNDLDLLSSELLQDIVKFDESQPFLRPAKRNNLDLVLYFDIDTADFEYSQLRSQSILFKSLLNDLAKGDNIRLSFIFSKKVNDTTKYITYDFKELDKIDKNTFPIIDEREYDTFLNSSYDSLGKAIFYLNWNKRKNNSRYLFGFTKRKLGNNVEEVSRIFNDNYVNFTYIILEGTEADVKSYNSTISQISNGNQIALSYFLEVTEPLYSKKIFYLLRDGEVYSIDYENSYNNRIDIYQNFNNFTDIDISKISYDLNVENIQQAVDFLYISGYSNSDDIRNIKYIANISGLIEESMLLMYRKNLSMFNKLSVYNNGITIEITLPLEVADIIIRNHYEDYKTAKITGNPLKILIGAKILKSNKKHGFDFDPFSLIFPKHIHYISKDLIMKNFLDFTNNPSFYSNNGIMEKNIWFFQATIVKIGE